MTLTHFLAAAEPAQAPSPLNGIVMMLIMMVAMWVILIRPQQKARKELAKKVEAMKVGDKVVTAGGLHGTVHKIKNSVVTLKVAEGVMIDFEKSSMQTVASKADNKSAKSEKAADKN